MPELTWLLLYYFLGGLFMFLLAPFVASLILTGIHAYLGVHVVERGVIFVDLALAQIAALGATMAVAALVVLGLAAVVGVRLFTNLAVPGWATFTGTIACSGCACSFEAATPPSR